VLLRAAGTENVGDLDPARREGIGDQLPVTPPGDRLSTHQCDRLGRSMRHNFVDGAPERL